MQHDMSRELFALEQKFGNAIKDRDAATAVALSDDHSVVVGAQGVVHTESLAGNPYGRR